MMGYVIIAAWAFGVITGSYIAWMLTNDHYAKRAADEMAEAFAAVPDPGRHRVTQPRMLPAAPKSAAPSTAAMWARLEAEVAPVTAPMRRQQLPQGPMLRDIVRPSAVHHPGRATDFIDALERDTDRFIAQMGARR